MKACKPYVHESPLGAYHILGLFCSSLPPPFSPNHVVERVASACFFFSSLKPPLPSTLLAHTTPPIEQDAAGHLVMKQLLKREAEAQQTDAATNSSDNNNNLHGSNGAAPDATSPAWFADALLKHAGGSISGWAGSNRGSFVVSALEAVPSASAGVRKVMSGKAAKAKLVKDAREGKNMGAKVCAIYEYTLSVYFC